MSEVSVELFQAVVYRLNDTSKEWQGVGGEEWAEVHILFEPFSNEIITTKEEKQPHGIYRIVGWIQDSGEVVLNHFISGKCMWVEVEPDFMQFTDENDEIIGLFFVNSRIAEIITSRINDIIQNDAALTREQRSNVGDDEAISDFLRKIGLAKYRFLFEERNMRTVFCLRFQSLRSLIKMKITEKDSMCILNSIPTSYKVEALKEKKSSPKSILSGHDNNYEKASIRPPENSQEIDMNSIKIYPTSPLNADGSNCSDLHVNPLAPEISCQHISNLDLSTSDCSSSCSDDACDDNSTNGNSNLTAGICRKGSTPLAAAPVDRPQFPSLNKASRSGSLTRRLSLAEFDEVEQATLAATSISPRGSQYELKDGKDTQEKSYEKDRCDCEYTFGKVRLAGDCNSNLTSSEDPISLPFKTMQNFHVTYNAKLARYEGLPAHWQYSNQQFGIPLAAVPKIKLEFYDNDRVPAVLEMMKTYFLANSGVTIEGIFRVAPEKDECLKVKESINNGTFEVCEDINIIANLIKVWFRELPESLFNVIHEKLIYQVCEMKDVNSIAKAIEEFPVSHRTLVYWLLDLMSEVVKNERLNKMSARNMAIVMSPNLFSIETDNPMFALTMSQKVAEFTNKILVSRLQLKHSYDCCI